MEYYSLHNMIFWYNKCQAWYNLPFHEGQWIYKFRARHNRLVAANSHPSLRMSSLLCLWITSSDNSNWWFPFLDLLHLSNEELLLKTQFLQLPIIPVNDRLEILIKYIWNQRKISSLIFTYINNCLLYLPDSKLHLGLQQDQQICVHFDIFSAAHPRFRTHHNEDKRRNPSWDEKNSVFLISLILKFVYW